MYIVPLPATHYTFLQTITSSLSYITMYEFKKGRSKFINHVRVRNFANCTKFKSNVGRDLYIFSYQIQVYNIDFVTSKFNQKIIVLHFTTESCIITTTFLEEHFDKLVPWVYKLYRLHIQEYHTKPNT